MVRCHSPDNWVFNLNFLAGCSKMFRPTSSNTSISGMKQQLIADVPSSWQGSTQDENEMVTLELVGEPAAKKNTLPRQKKTKKDIGPKRAKTSYFFYATDERKKIKAGNPNLLLTEVTKLVGQRWKDISWEEKEKYLDFAKMDRARYEQEVKEFIEGGGVMPKSKLTKPTSNLCAKINQKSVPAELLPYQNPENDYEEGNDAYNFADVEMWDDVKWTFFKEEEFDNSKCFN